MIKIVKQVENLNKLVAADINNIKRDDSEKTIKGVENLKRNVGEMKRLIDSL